MIYIDSQCVSSQSIVGLKLIQQLQERALERYDYIIAFYNEHTKELLDLQQTIQGPIHLIPITKNHEHYIEILRHDCEHILAHAVMELFPDTLVLVGANMNHGFGYDFQVIKPFTQENIAAIETRMLEIIDRKLPIIRELWTMEEAKQYYENNEIKYKILTRLEDAGEQSVTMYAHQTNDPEKSFFDLCRGPHGQNTSLIPKYFKLTGVSAVQSQILPDACIQRITGVLFESEELLKSYLEKLELIKSQDHRKLAQKMDLYHIEEHTPGVIFWHPNGWAIMQILENYMRKLLRASGYIEVETPALINIDLWKRSGHWEKFSENMFYLKSHDVEYALKPMNCPAHCEIFKSHFLGGVKSYHSLPIRMSEFGQVYRSEATGALQGLKRLRKFTQDDAHIFCTPEQIEDEIVRYCHLFKTVYAEFGFTKYHVDLSTRPVNKLGTEEAWNHAETALAQGAKQAGITYSIAEGEGAFYGPKLDFHVFDGLDRKWQCCTLQLDFQLPQRLEVEYIDNKGERQNPVMIHRAVYGSMERFLALVLENTNGFLPIWAAAVQCVILTVGLDEKTGNKTMSIDNSNADHEVYTLHCALLQKFTDQLTHANVRFKVDSRNETLGYKVREHAIARVELAIIIGKKEAANNQVTIKNLRTTEQQTVSLQEGVKYMIDVCALPEYQRM